MNRQIFTRISSFLFWVSLISASLLFLMMLYGLYTNTVSKLLLYALFRIPYYGCILGFITSFFGVKGRSRVKNIITNGLFVLLFDGFFFINENAPGEYNFFL